MKLSKLFLWGLFLIVAAGIFFYAQYPKQDVQPTNNAQKQFDKLAQKYASIVGNQDPQVALATLASDVKENKGVSREFCHELAHEIGHTAYEKYQNFGETMQYSNKLCISGYTHGVVEWLFDGSDNIKDTMNSLCSEYETGSFLSLHCHHGVGHGLMYQLKNNLFEAVTLCESYENSFKSFFCTDGAMMEVFNTRGNIHPSELLDLENPAKICSEMTNPSYKKGCYVYAGEFYFRTHENNFEKTFAWCSEVDPLYREFCIHGVSGEIVELYPEKAKRVEEICSSSALKNPEDCIVGALNSQIWYTSSLEKGKQLCEGMLRSENQIVCLKALEAEAAMFPNK